MASVRLERTLSPLRPAAGTRRVGPSLAGLHRHTFAEGWAGLALLAGCLLLVGAVGGLDYAVGRDLSLAILYLVPIAAAAWWGGLAHGLLLSLAGALAWHLVQALAAPAAAPGARLWNEAVYFGFFAITSSLLARVRAGVLREQRLARADGLTGVANGRAFYERLRLEVQRVRRSAQPEAEPYLDERRVAPRQRCSRLARVSVVGVGESAVELAVVHDLSAVGLGLYLERRLAEGTLLAVEAVSVPGAKTLLARTVRAARRDSGWLHGCTLSVRLAEAELELWLPAPAVQPV
jgi:hypothetical protein